jgi:hypothetical protein
MSVMVTSLFASGHVSVGTLLATYVATSDEALPILIAEGRHGRVVFWLIATKLVIAVAAGYLADGVLGRQRALGGKPEGGGGISSHTETVSWVEPFVHGLRHTAIVVVWVFAVTLALGLVVESSGSLEWAKRSGPAGFTRVLAVATFGLIPNCAVSVAITEAFLRAGMPFGTTIAGLSAGAGFGPIVLLREVDRRQAVVVLAWLLGIAVVSGLAIDAFYPLSLPVAP